MSVSWAWDSLGKRRQKYSLGIILLDCQEYENIQHSESILGKYEAVLQNFSKACNDIGLDAYIVTLALDQVALETCKA